MVADAVCEDANAQFSRMGNFYFSGRNGTNQIRRQNNINTSGPWLTGAQEGHRSSTLTFKHASPALVSVCKCHIWPLPHDSSSILINIKASISVCPLNAGQGSVRKMPSGCLACGNSPRGRGPLWGLHSLEVQAGGSRHGQDALGNPF